VYAHLRQYLNKFKYKHLIFTHMCLVFVGPDALYKYSVLINYEMSIIGELI